MLFYFSILQRFVLYLYDVCTIEACDVPCYKYLSLNAPSNCFCVVAFVVLGLVYSILSQGSVLENLSRNYLLYVNCKV